MQEGLKMQNKKRKSKIEQWVDEDFYSEQEEIQEEVIPERGYKKMFVAWIDILGIRNKIKNKEKYSAEKIFKIMENLGRFVKEDCDEYAAKQLITYTQIADGVIIACDLLLKDKIFYIVANIQWRIFIELNLISRGAITIGDVSIAELSPIIIGPAYVDAYALESEIAIYPRVIVTNEAHQYLTENKILCPFLTRDTDEIYFIDFISYIIDQFKLTNQQIKQLLIQYSVASMIKYECENHLSDMRVRQKYGWIITLLNKHNINILRQEN